MTKLHVQLEQVRRRGRWLLFAQPVMLFAAAVLVGLIVLGWMDYMLRFPAWIRLPAAAGLAAWALIWLAGRLREAWRFNPDLARLALRLERMYPQLTGRLASAVEFATPGEASPVMHQMQQASLAGVAGYLPDVKVSRLIDWSPTFRRLMLLLICVAATAALLTAAPRHAEAALARWLAPWVGASYPRATQLASTVDAQVWPGDEPVRLSASVERGYQKGMTVKAYYRVRPAGAATGGAWQRVLLNEQADQARFEQFLDLPALGALGSTPGDQGSASSTTSGGSGGGQVVEFYFTAGDDQTAVQQLTRVPRPAVAALTATVDPPAYADGLVAPRSLALHETAGQLVNVPALRGSTVQLQLQTTKPVQPDALDAGWAPGHWRPADASDTRFTLSLKVDQPFEAPVTLRDSYGLENDHTRRYRFEPTADAPPSATMTQPASDEMVLPTAVLDAAGSGRDDVGLDLLRLEAVLERTTTAASDNDHPITPSPHHPITTLAQQELRRSSLDVAATVEVERFGARPGDVLTLTTVARDVYLLDGQRHEPVRSAPRKLRIIDKTELIRQVRSDLAGIRQQADRLRERQDDIAQLANRPAAASDRQAALSQRIEAQQRALENVDQRLERNRLEDEVLDQTLARADALLDTANQSSQQAAAQSSEAASESKAAQQAGQSDAQRAEHQARAEQASQQAAAAQQQVGKSLNELIDLLDQGRDVAKLTEDLRQLDADQRELSQQTREMLPRTIGKFRDQLTDAQRQALDELSEQQRQLSEQARELAREMQAAADALEQQSDDDRDRAAAQALREAAKIAEQQGLTASMQQSGQSIQQNQMAQAGSSQQQSQDTLAQMMDEMNSQQQRMAEMLKRRLEELKQAIERLIQQQTGEINHLVAAPEGRPALSKLEPGMMNLRVSTMAVQEKAKGEKTQPIADLLGQAVDEQTDAVKALREADKEKAKVAEDRALARLKAALDKTAELKKQAESEEANAKRDQLRKQYEVLADRQDALRAKVEAKQAENLPARQTRPDYLEMGQEQAELQSAIEQLGQQIEGEDAAVFKAIQQQAEQAAGRAAAELRRGRADAEVPRDQTTTARRLRLMAKALEKSKKKDDDFSDKSDSGGGGGGGGGGKPQMIPPTAELKLLREVQTMLKDDTQALAGEMADAPSADARSRLRDLANQQRELGALGETMLKKVQQQMQPPASRPAGEGEQP